MKGQVIHITLLKRSLLPERRQTTQQQFLKIMLQTIVTQMIVPCNPIGLGFLFFQWKNKKTYSSTAVHGASIGIIIMINNKQ